MDVDRIAQEWQAHGFVILPGYIPAGELAPAMGELEVVFPPAPAASMTAPILVRAAWRVMSSRGSTVSRLPAWN
jgi:hypothetical protein